MNEAGRYRPGILKEIPIQILYFAKDSETQRDVVVYRALYGEGGVWVRPMEMFFSPVDREKYPSGAGISV